jgi:hypothetical protein
VNYNPNAETEDKKLFLFIDIRPDFNTTTGTAYYDSLMNSIS